jgi:hypothetical protein
MDEALATPFIIEERTSSFVEMSPKSNAKSARASRASKRTVDDQRPSASGTRHSTVVYSEKDANAMILKANAPPNYNGGFDGTRIRIAVCLGLCVC